MFLRRKKNTDTAPLLTEAAGRWLPAPLALLLTPGQASSLRVELALRPGERPVLALETLQADAGTVRLRGQGTLELATAADVLASPLALDCSLAVSSAADAAALLPQARALLAPLGDALRLDIGVKGSPGAPEPRLELACATLDLGGHAVNDLSLLAGGEALPWPQLAAKGKVELPLSLQVRTGKDHISTKLRLRAGHDGAAWLLGLPQLELHGAGARLDGALLALLPDAPQEMPVVPAASAEKQAPLPVVGEAGTLLAPVDTAGQPATALPAAPVPASAADAAAAPVPPAPAIVGSDFVPARLLAQLFPDPGTRPRLWASLYGEIEDWAALGRVLDYWSPGLRLEKKDDWPVRLMLRAGGLPCAPDKAEELPLAAVAGLADPAFLCSQDWQQWFSLDADVGFLRLHDRGGERLLLRELHQHLRIDDIFGRGKLEQRLDVRQLHAAGLRLERVLVGLKGELATPLEAELACAGDIRAKLRLRWQGDRLEIPVCDLHLKQGVGLRLQAGTALVLDKDGLSLRRSGCPHRACGAGTGHGQPEARGHGCAPDAGQHGSCPVAGGGAGPAFGRAGFPEPPARQSRGPCRDLPAGRAATGSPAKLPAAAGSGPDGQAGRQQRQRTSGHTAGTASLHPAGPGSGAGRSGSPPAPAFFRQRPALAGHDGPAFRASGLAGPSRSAPLWRLVPVADRRVTGRLDMHLALAGSLAVPTAKGRLEVAGGRYGRTWPWASC